MISKAVGKYIRISPRKARTVIALVKGRDVNESMGILKASNNRASSLIIKLLKSAVANAKRFPNIDEADLYISDIYADGGPVLKRFRAEAMGRASVLRKPTSHIIVVLDTEVTPDKSRKKPLKLSKEKTKRVEAKAQRKEKVKKKGINSSGS
jgi:large subunit ribosomal protein L22